MTRERILAAAAPIFAARGFDGATTRALAEAAGVNIATLAWHFKDKQGLYDAVIAAMYEDLLALQLPEELPAASEERVRLLTRCVLRFARERRDTIRLVQRHLLESDRLPGVVSARYTPALLARAQAIVASLGLPPERDWRLPLLSLNHLITRFALMGEADLATWGLGFEDVERHVEDAAVLLLTGP